MTANIPESTKLRVVIIGAGFGGFTLAKALKNSPVQVVLVDKNNFKTFQPLLYQVATAELEASSIAYPIRDAFKCTNDFVFRMADVIQLDSENNCVITSIGSIKYDYCVIAVGTTTNYFGMEDMEKLTFPLKTVSDAMLIRNEFLNNFEKALINKGDEQRESLMSVVIVGGGPTGVENAGALAELKNRILPKDYPELDLGKMHICIVEREDRLLKMMSDKSSANAQAVLEKRGVKIILNQSVESFDGEHVVLGDGDRIHADTVIWAAGVKGALPGNINDQAVVRGNRLKVNVYNTVQGYDNVYAIGDVAAMITDELPRGHPQLAPVATQQAHQLARNILLSLANKNMRPFKYVDKGSMATIGRNQAVVDLPFMKFHGILAWFMWGAVHLLLLDGFRNKMIAFLNWTWSYMTHSRGLRLIFRDSLRNNVEIDKAKESVT